MLSAIAPPLRRCARLISYLNFEYPCSYTHGRNLSQFCVGLTRPSHTSHYTPRLARLATARPRSPAAPRPGPRPPRRSYQRAPTCDSTVRPRRPAGLRAARDERRERGRHGRRRAPGRARGASRDARAGRRAPTRAVRAGSLPVATRPAPARARLACSVPPFSRLTVSFDIMLHMHIAALADRYGIYGALKQRAQSHCGLTPHARSHPPPRAAPQPHRDRRGALPRAATSWS